MGGGPGQHQHMRGGKGKKGTEKGKMWGRLVPWATGAPSFRKLLRESVQCSSVILTDGQRRWGVYPPLLSATGRRLLLGVGDMNPSSMEGQAAASQVFSLDDFRFLCMGMGSAKGLVGSTYNVCYCGHPMSLL